MTFPAKLTNLMKLRALWYYFPSSHYALLSIFFFIGLELIALLQRWILLLIGILLAIVTIGIALIRAEEDQYGKFHPVQMILPAMAAFGLAGFALFISAGVWLHAYLVGSAVLFFYLLKHGVKQAYPTWNWVISLAIVFVSLASVLGWRFHLYVPLIIVIPIVFGIFALISLQSFWRYTNHFSEALLIALSISFVLSEFMWALQFLPLHFIVQSGVGVALYYVLFQLTSTSLERSLTKRDILEYSAVTAGALILLLATARWV